MGTFGKILLLSLIGFLITFGIDYIFYLILKYIRKKPFKNFAEFLENNFKYGL